MASMSVEQFSKAVVESGLLPSEELDAFFQTLPPDKHPSDGAEVAGALVAADKLTPFQAQMVSTGQGKGLVLGNYVIQDKLGAGGMGEVYKAYHRRMGRIVALKVLSSQALASPQALARFQREVFAAARLQHPNAVAAFDASESDGKHFLVMEFVDGQDLSKVVRTRGPLPWPEAVDCIVQSARGLEYAHSQGVIHRDVKPANLLLDRAGQVKLLDLGIARFEQVAGQPEEQSLTVTKQAFGTVAFMAPEQAVSAKHVDHRADIYSLGCTLYYLVTGKPPYEAETPWLTVLAHREEPIPRLRAFDGSVPDMVDRVLEKMLAKKPEHRYASMGAVIADLEICLAQAGFTPRHAPQGPRIMTGVGSAASGGSGSSGVQSALAGSSAAVAPAGSSSRGPATGATPIPSLPPPKHTTPIPGNRSTSPATPPPLYGTPAPGSRGFSQHAPPPQHTPPPYQTPSGGLAPATLPPPRSVRSGSGSSSGVTPVPQHPTPAPFAGLPPSTHGSGVQGLSAPRGLAPSGPKARSYLPHIAAALFAAAVIILGGALLVAMLGGSGTLSIEVDQANVEVLVDGRRIGEITAPRAKTPFSLAASNRRRELILRKAGFDDAREEFTLKSGETYSTSVQLKPRSIDGKTSGAGSTGGDPEGSSPGIPKTPAAETATIAITVDQPSAEIFIDGDKKFTTVASGQTWSTSLPVAGIARSLRVTKSGFQPFTQSLQLTAGQRLSIPVKLVPLAKPAGVLVLTCLPVQGAVELDGKSMGYASSAHPLTITLPPGGGEHRLLASAAGYQTQIRTIRVPDGERQSLTITFEVVPKTTPSVVTRRPEFAFIPTGFSSATYIHPSRITASPLMRGASLEEWFYEQFPNARAGPRQMDKFIVLIELANQGESPITPAFVVELLRGTTTRQMIVEGWPDAEEVRLEGKTYYRSQERGLPNLPIAAYLPSDQLGVWAHEPTLRRMITRWSSRNTLVDQLEQTDLDHEVVSVLAIHPIRRKLLDQIDDPAKPIPDLFLPAARTVSRATAVTAYGDLDGPVLFSISMRCASDSDASEFKTQLEQLVQVAKNALPQIRESIRNEFPSDKAEAMIAIVEGLLQYGQVRRSGSDVAYEVPQLATFFLLPKLITLIPKSGGDVPPAPRPGEGEPGTPPPAGPSTPPAGVKTPPPAEPPVPPPAP